MCDYAQFLAAHKHFFRWTLRIVWTACSTAAADGRSACNEWTPPHSFAGRFAPPSFLQCECPSCQGDPPQTNSRMAKPYITICLSWKKCVTCLGLSFQTNTCLLVWWIASCVQPWTSTVQCVHQVAAFVRHAQKCKTIHFIIFKFFVLQIGRLTDSKKCSMVGPRPDLGYSRGAEIFRNVEAMWAKESAAKEKDAVSKAR